MSGLTIPRTTPRIRRVRRWQRLERRLWELCGAVACGLALAVVLDLAWRAAA